MRVIMDIVGAIVLFAGIFLLFRAVTAPAGFPLSMASAVQITQVYTEAIYYGILAIGAFMLAGILLIALGTRNENG